MKHLLLVVAMLVLCTSAFAFDNATTAGLNGAAVSVSLVNQEPDPALAGSTVEVRLGVQNGGRESVNDLEMEIIPSYPFTIAPGEEAVQTLGTIEGYQGQLNDNQKVVKYTLLVDKDATAGMYDLKVNLRQQGTSKITQKLIEVEVKNKQNAEIIHIDKTIIIPGKHSNITFTINNVGDSPLKDLTFSWEDKNDVILPVGSDNTQYIKYLAVGDSADLRYQVIADTNADPGLYKINLHLTYEDPTDGLQNISTAAGVYVGGGTDFDIAFSDSGSAQTAFSIANTGSNPAYSVSVSIPEQPGWRVSGSDSAIIGNLNKGDYTIASFSLQNTARNITGSSSVLVSVAYSDTTGERQTMEKLVKVGTVGNSTRTQAFQAQQQSTLSKYKWYLIGIVVILLGYFGYRAYRRQGVTPKKRGA